ncbi:unnamed protein product [Candidula unifasciata]|uniref:G-protein coupled receptors family 1 profile domain-containing protein n=1 Tax=Candidula unifasciata TaxID=100452 RepID=A0A8S3YI11_9EUPU|nr:unnamed protein product [Candidula unifasciata]
MATHACLSTTDQPDYKAQGYSRQTFLVAWARTVPLVFLAFSTVVFNLMILWMFKVKRSLRSCKNIYLASLAIADLLIGLCMFLAIVQQLKGHVKWLPMFSCRLYLVLRQSALYVSLLSLVLITGDRWWSIHYPFSYRSKRSTRNAFVAVGCVWVFAFALHVPPVTLWDLNKTFESSNLTAADFNLEDQALITCELPFVDSVLFVSIVSAVIYFIPLMAVLSLNCSLYVGILQRKRVQIRRSVSASDKLTWLDRRTSVSSIPDFASMTDENMHLLNGTNSRRGQMRLNSKRRNSADVVLLRSSAPSPLFNNMNSGRRFSWAPRKNYLVRPSKCGEELAKNLLVKQDRKAAFWLGLLVAVFLVCWLPHTIVGILQSGKQANVPQWTKDVTFWLLLANSAINPLMYGLFNREIRRAFKQWLCGGSGRKWRARNALLLYGVSLTTAVAVPKRISSFEAVPE